MRVSEGASELCKAVIRVVPIAGPAEQWAWRSNRSEYKTEANPIQLCNISHPSTSHETGDCSYYNTSFVCYSTFFSSSQDSALVSLFYMLYSMTKSMQLPELWFR